MRHDIQKQHTMTDSSWSFRIKLRSHFHSSKGRKCWYLSRCMLGVFSILSQMFCTAAQARIDSSNNIWTFETDVQRETGFSESVISTCFRNPVAVNPVSQSSAYSQPISLSADRSGIDCVGLLQSCSSPSPVHLALILNTQLSGTHRKSLESNQ